MSAEPIRVLLVEHEEAFARALAGMLEQAREAVREVVWVPSLTEALARLARERFDVILLEFFLPDGAGLPNIALFKERAPDVPLIALGGVDEESLAVEVVHAGAQDYLVKSQISPRWLLRSIRYALERQAAERALLEAEKKYRSLFDHLVEGIFQTTPEGRYLLANPALARIYGYDSPEELMASITDIGRKLYVQPGRREEFKRIMEERDVLTGFESQIYRKDGSIIWISENCRAIRDAQGRLLYYEGTVEDITQRRQAEQNLRDSEALYHSLVETLPQNIFRKDREGRFTFANQRFCQALGRRLEEIVGKTDFDFFPRELAQKYRADDLRVMATGETFDTVEEHQDPGREKIFVRVIKTPLHDADGNVIGVQGMFWDITRERQMEEDLRRSEALYHSLVETMPQCIFRKDLQGRYTFVNPQFCKVLGHPPEEILGKTVYDFLPPEIARERERDDRQVLETGRTLEQIEESRFHGSEQRFIHVLKIPIFDAQGRVVGIQGMFWDITPQKMAEERLRRANAELARRRAELHRKNAQMEEDLKMAAELQSAMLPQQLPAFPPGGAPETSAFRFTHRYQPSGTVGGDFFNVTALSDTEAAVFICDVAGHGVRSALVAAMIRALVEELRPLARQPNRFLTKLNSDLFAILKHVGSPVLTTAFFFVADAATGRVRYANAGHPTPLVLRREAGRVEPLPRASRATQPALGLFEDSQFHAAEIALAPRDVLLLFTDGLLEIHAPERNELYSQTHLIAALQRRLDAPLGDLLDGVLAEARQFAGGAGFEDDVCLVGMEYVGAAVAVPG
jgi:sigma-B regulation protein RsbU (phosphoserine phosphatase)